MFKSNKQRAFLEGMKNDPRFTKQSSPSMLPSTPITPANTAMPLPAAIPGLSKLAGAGPSQFGANKPLATPHQFGAPPTPKLPMPPTSLAPNKPMLPPTTNTPLGRESLGKSSRFQGIKSKLKF